MRTPRSFYSRFGCFLWTSLVCLGALLSVAVAADWPNYRGPAGDGISPDRINKQWTGAVTNPIWRLPLGNGLSSLTVSAGRVFTQIKRNLSGNKEVCVALNATNGVELWGTVVDTASYPNGGVGFDDGPRSTPVVDGNSVYVLTSYLKLFRLNATNGVIIWQTNLVSGFGANVIPWQNAASPVVENGLIFVNANAGTQRILALRTNDGSLAWRSHNEGMTHSTPVLTTMYGVRQLILATQNGLLSLNPLTGTQLWRTNYPFNYSISIGASPVVWSNIVFITMNYAQGSAAFRVVPTNATFAAHLLWRDSALESHWMTAVATEGYLYGMFTPDNEAAELRCIDIQTGAQKWAQPDFGRGGIALVDGHLLLNTETGDLVLVKPITNAYTEVARFTAITNYLNDYNRCWNSAAIAAGRVYVRATAAVAAFDLSVPDLQLDPPQLATANQINLTVRTTTGSPVAANRLAGMEIKTAPDPAGALAAWTKLTNDLMLINGVVHVTNVDASPARQFFIVSEPR